jgi:hypothetical protein
MINSSRGSLDHGFASARDQLRGLLQPSFLTTHVAESLAYGSLPCKWLLA